MLAADELVRSGTSVLGLSNNVSIGRPQRAVVVTAPNEATGAGAMADTRR